MTSLKHANRRWLSAMAKVAAYRGRALRALSPEYRRLMASRAHEFLNEARAYRNILEAA